MRIVKVLLVIVSLMLLNGCASTFKVNAKIMEYRDSLSQQQALEIFHDALAPKANSMGVCNYAGLLLDDSERPQPTANGFEVRVYSRGEQIRTEVRQGVKYNIYEKVYAVEKFDLKKLTKMRVMPSVGQGHCKESSKGDYAVLVHIGFATFATFDLANDDLEKFLAAMIVLAPQAEIIEGYGI